jgi:hypothetical protein
MSYSQYHDQQGSRSNFGPVETHLFPFRASRKKRYYRAGDSGASCDNGGMVDELICAKLEEEQSAHERCYVVGNGVTVSHDGVLGSGNAWGRRCV